MSYLSRDHLAPRCGGTRGRPVPQHERGQGKRTGDEANSAVIKHLPRPGSPCPGRSFSPPKGNARSARLCRAWAEAAQPGRDAPAAPAALAALHAGAGGTSAPAALRSRPAAPCQGTPRDSEPGRCLAAPPGPGLTTEPRPLQPGPGSPRRRGSSCPLPPHWALITPF